MCACVRVGGCVSLFVSASASQCGWVYARGCVCVRVCATLHNRESLAGCVCLTHTLSLSLYLSLSLSLSLCVCVGVCAFLCACVGSVVEAPSDPFACAAATAATAATARSSGVRPAEDAPLCSVLCATRAKQSAAARQSAPAPSVRTTPVMRKSE